MRAVGPRGERTLALSADELKFTTENSKGVRAPNLPQIRDILNEEFEKMLAGQQDAATALKAAVERGNAAIRDAAGG